MRRLTFHITSALSLLLLLATVGLWVRSNFVIDTYSWDTGDFGTAAVQNIAGRVSSRDLGGRIAMCGHEKPGAKLRATGIHVH